MSEPIPEAIPTSADPRSRRPVKRIRTGNANTALASQADEIEALMWDPSRPVTLPASSSEAKSKSLLPAPPEIVANVQGSSAGAGSGEFHVYKASRRREYERLKTMDEEAKQEEDNQVWEKEEKTRKEKDDEKTRKNREKRNRRKKVSRGTGDASGQSGQGKETSAAPVNEKTGKAHGKEEKRLNLPRLGRSTSPDQKSDFAIADVVKEVGITIHDDD